MLHLRVITPADHAEKVLDLLRAAPGATHLAHLPGAALAPPGDVVEADVAREAADEVLTGLCALGLDHTGGITLETLDISLSDAADAAEEAAPGDPADAVVWQGLIARTGEESRLTASFLAFLVIACLLAAIGAVTDSPVTVVGAMVLGPEFGPLAAIAVGLVQRRPDLLRRAALAIGLGFPIGMAVTALGTLLGRWVGLFGAQPLAHTGQVDFIYQVGPLSLVIALLAGAAGMLALTGAKSATLVGVFISVTTVPAAGVAAVAAVLGEWARAASSVVQLAVNLVGIVLAGALVLLLAGRRRRSRDRGRPLSAG